MFSGSALIDLLAILPFYLMLGGFVSDADMRFLRMLRLMRVFKLTRYSAAFDILQQAFQENARSLAAAFFILIMVMLIAATGRLPSQPRIARSQWRLAVPAGLGGLTFYWQGIQADGQGVPRYLTNCVTTGF